MSDETPPPTPPEEPAAEPTGEEPEALVCKKCAAPLDGDQTYCLECGEPTPVAPPLRPRRRRAALATAGLLALGGGAGALAYAVATDSDGSTRAVSGVAPTPSVNTSQPPTVTGTTIDTSGLPTVSTGGLTDTGGIGTDTIQTDTVPTDTTFTDPGLTDTVDTSGTDATTTDETTTEDTTTDETTETTTDDTTGSSGSSEWPAGTTGWTVQVASVRNRAGASRLVRRMTAAGEEAGLIFSSDYANFKRAGYWVVFSGTFDDRASALERQTKLAGRFGPTIVRRIEG